MGSFFEYAKKKEENSGVFKAENKTEHRHLDLVELTEKQKESS